MHVQHCSYLYVCMWDVVGMYVCCVLIIDINWNGFCWFPSGTEALGSATIVGVALGTVVTLIAFAVVMLVLAICCYWRKWAYTTGTFMYILLSVSLSCSISKICIKIHVHACLSTLVDRKSYIIQTFTNHRWGNLCLINFLLVLFSSLWLLNKNSKRWNFTSCTKINTQLTLTLIICRSNYFTYLIFIAKGDHGNFFNNKNFLAYGTYTFWFF